ncbi:MAG: hypothetical protein QOE22_153 [Candidatus Parcubacteria bacterium]|nr:hypothetical protein [Candidatus Parcubacteria bacterium]
MGVEARNPAISANLVKSPYHYSTGKRIAQKRGLTDSLNM